MHVRSSPASILRLLIGLSIMLAGLSILLSRLLLPIRPDLLLLGLAGLIGAALFGAIHHRRPKGAPARRPTLAGER